MPDKTTNWVKLTSKQLYSLYTAQRLSNEWSNLRCLSIHSKVRTSCITHGLTLEVNGLTCIFESVFMGCCSLAKSFKSAAILNVLIPFMEPELHLLWEEWMNVPTG